MQFDQFIAQLEAALGALRPAAAAAGTRAAKEARVTWSVRERRAAVTLVAPLNVSVALEGGAQPPVTTWYPIDAALVPLVSRRIAGYLSEA